MRCRLRSWRPLCARQRSFAGARRVGDWSLHLTLHLTGSFSFMYKCATAKCVLCRTQQGYGRTTKKSRCLLQVFT